VRAARASSAAVSASGAGEFFSVACALLWAIATVLFRRSGETVPPIALNLFKNAVAVALFLVTIPIAGVPWFPPERSAQDWLVLLGSGALGIGIGDSLWFATLNRLGAGGSAIVSCLYCPMVVLCAAAWLGEPLGPLVLISTALMGAAIVVGNWDPWTPRTAEDRRRVAAGVTIGLASMVSMAVWIVAAKPVLDRSDPIWASAVRLVGGVAFLLVQALAPNVRREMLRVFRPGRAWAYAIPAAVLGAWAGMVLWIVGMKYAGAGTASILNQTATIFTPILGVAVLKERMTARKAVGIAMAFGGAALVLV